MVKDYRAKKLLKEEPIDFELVKEHTGALNFPGKVLADAQSNRLFIADSTNHRIVITTLDGKKIAVAGSGTEGLKDGAFAEARFSDPQGMALVGDTLYVADRKNHALRALELKDQTVKLVAGTGGQDRSAATAAGPPSRPASIAPGTCSITTTSYSSPWPAIIRSGPSTRPSKLVNPFAGNGRENIGDGPLADASFAQPSGLTSDGTTLYVADSEISAIRALAP